MVLGGLQSYLMHSFWQHWYVCGDIECFKSYHLPLALLAMLTLLACILAIPLTAAIAMKKVIKTWCPRTDEDSFRNFAPISLT